MYTVEEFDKEKTKVFKYIVYKKRTEQEVRNKFRSLLEKDMLEDIIGYLKEAGYINDSMYIERAISEYMVLKNLSIRELKYKLYSKGMDRNIIESYFSSHDEELREYEERSRQNILQKKASSMTEEEIKGYLMKKGYSRGSEEE